MPFRVIEIWQNFLFLTNISYALSNFINIWFLVLSSSYLWSLTYSPPPLSSFLDQLVLFFIFWHRCISLFVLLYYFLSSLFSYYCNFFFGIFYNLMASPLYCIMIFIFVSLFDGLCFISFSSYFKVMTYFKDFIEDYNTATMPHEKYYNYEAWEMNEYRKAQLNKINKTGVIINFF